MFFFFSAYTYLGEPFTANAKNENRVGMLDRTELAFIIKLKCQQPISNEDEKTNVQVLFSET